MSRVVVINHMTLDGVMQAPARPDEDTRSGFAYGGWAVGRNDAVMNSVMAEGMAHGGALSAHRTGNRRDRLARPTHICTAGSVARPMAGLQSIEDTARG